MRILKVEGRDMFNGRSGDCTCLADGRCGFMTFLNPKQVLASSGH